MSSDFDGCASTLVLQFPDEVYCSSGESVVLPELLKSVDVPKVCCIQFIRNGLVRVTFDDTACCDAALSSGVMFRGARLPASPVSARSRLVYVQDLPAEVPECFVKDVLCLYETVLGVSAMEHSGYPGLMNGTRLVIVTLEKDVPSSLRICGFNIRVWYRGQPQACAICHSYRHRVKECPLNGLCRRCHKPGHVARECCEPRRVPAVPQEPLSTLSMMFLIVMMLLMLILYLSMCSSPPPQLPRMTRVSSPFTIFLCAVDSVLLSTPTPIVSVSPPSVYYF